VRRIVNDPRERIFTRPVTVCEWAWMAWRGITLERFELLLLLLPHNWH